MKRSKRYEEIKSLEMVLHQTGDKTLTKIFLFANTIEQGVARLQEKFPEKNYCMKDVITHRFIKNEEIVNYVNTFHTEKTLKPESL